MREHAAAVAESLGPVSADVPDPPPAPLTPRRILLRAVFYFVLTGAYFATSTWMDWERHGLSSGSAVSTVIAVGLLAMGVSRLRDFRRARGRYSSISPALVGTKPHASK